MRRVGLLFDVLVMVGVAAMAAVVTAAALIWWAARDVLGLSDD